MATKNTINAAGALAAAAIVLAGGFFVAKPQFSAASDLREKTSKVEEARTIQEGTLAVLKRESENLPVLQEEVEALKAQITDEEDIAAVARVVVTALPPGVALDSFVHRPMVKQEPTAEPAVTLAAPEAPVEEEVDPAAPKGTPSGPPVLQQIPVVITISASSNEQVTDYIENLAEGPRLILVQQVAQTVSETGQRSVAIYGYAFANAPELKTSTATTTEDAPAS